MPGSSLDHRSVSVCERAYETWFSQRGSGDAEIPLSVFAAFMLAGKIDGITLLASRDEEIVQGIREVWSMFWLRRPDLCTLCGPLAGWLNEEPLRKDVVRAIAAMARTAVRAGICEIVRDGNLKDTDLLGHAYIAMRPKSARDARGEFYTPAPVCTLMARMTGIGDLEPGMSIAEPAAGTGGMLRAAAEVLRWAGKDPHEFSWVANDISPLVTAALAVNCHVWDLGLRVIVGAADTLAEPDWYVRADAHRLEAFRRRDDLIKDATMLAMLRHLDTLFAGEITPEPAPAPETVPAKFDVILPPDGTLFEMPPADPATRPAPRTRPRPAIAAPNDEEVAALF